MVGTCQCEHGVYPWKNDGRGETKCDKAREEGPDEMRIAFNKPHLSPLLLHLLETQAGALLLVAAESSLSSALRNTGVHTIISQGRVGCDGTEPLGRTAMFPARCVFKNHPITKKWRL